MKTILKKGRIIWDIAFTELQTMFYSPIAWLTLVIFAMQVAFIFIAEYTPFVTRFELGHKPVNISYSVFSKGDGLFDTIVPYLLYYFPLLTMSLISREFNKGSIKLLYSSPITNFQIIMGKYLSMMIYSLALIAVIVVFVIFGAFTIENFDLPMIITGLFGIYLLMCAYSAIGLFVSSLVSYQIVAALGTLAIFSVLRMVGGMWQDVEILRDITWWLSINGRVNEFIVGLICSEDVLYYIILSSLFIALSVLRLRANRQKIKWTKAWRSYIVAVLVACTFGYISSRPALMSFYDASRFKRNTLTPKSQEVISKLTGPLKITTYVNILENNYPNGIPRNWNRDFALFKQYWRFKPELEMEYVYYYHKTYNPELDRSFPHLNDKERMIEMAKREKIDTSRFLTPEQINSKIDLSGEDYRFVRQIEAANGEKSFLRIYNDFMIHPLEGEISVALKRLIMQLPVVGITSGRGERGIDSYGDRGYALFARNLLFRYSLPNQGFDVAEVSFKKQIPDSINIVVIADPRENFDEQERVNMNQYVQRGGNLLIAGDVNKQDVLNPFLEQFGVQLMPGRLVSPSEHYDPDFVISKAESDGWKMSYPYSRMYRRPVIMPGCVAIDYSKAQAKGFETTPIFTTDSTRIFWNELQTKDFINEKVDFNPEVGEKMGEYTTGVGLKRTLNGKEQRIIILGDADCISNAEHNTKRKGLPAYNYAIISGSFYWLSNNEAPFDTRRPKSIDNQIKINLAEYYYFKMLLQWIIPSLMLGFAIIIWIRRRNR